MTRPRPRTVGWLAQGQVTKAFIVGNRKLVVACTNEELDGSGKWAALAFETTGSGIGAILDHHAHHVIGMFAEIREAMLEADAYGTGWLEGATADLAECECDEIAGPPPLLADP